MEEKIKFNSWKNKKLVRVVITLLGILLGILFLLIFSIIVAAVVDSANDKPVEKNMVCAKAGLGDTIENIEKEWNHGFRKEIGNKVFIGYQEDVGVLYSTGYKGFSFGEPKRVGEITGMTTGLFGADSTYQPSLKLFYSGVRDIIPKDSVLINSYICKNEPTIRVFTFQSDSLAKIPGIENTYPYRDKKVPDKIGSFNMMVSEDLERNEFITSFSISIGLPKDNGTLLKKVDYDPWK